ncbi:MAG: hypothetical protein NUV81_00505 [bacterium]|nr:hypothetical protein [bacterium]
MQNDSITPKISRKISGRGYDSRHRAVVHAAKLDRKRILDRQLRWLLDKGYVSDKQMLALNYCIDLQSVVRGAPRWPANTLRLLRRLMGSDANIMWNEVTNMPTLLGCEVWARFRRRIRREGALLRVVEGRILDNEKPVALPQSARRAS